MSLTIREDRLGGAGVVIEHGDSTVPIGPDEWPEVRSEVEAILSDGDAAVTIRIEAAEDAAELFAALMTYGLRARMDGYDDEADWAYEFGMDLHDQIDGQLGDDG